MKEMKNGDISESILPNASWSLEAIYDLVSINDSTRDCSCWPCDGDYCIGGG